MTAPNHELVVFRTDLPDDALPVGKEQGMEHTLKNNRGSGRYRAWPRRADLQQAGPLYEAGMQTALVVTP
ncbi:hypothetical protein [Burkholderia cepacia]|uniref:hypothetical protein n=1 Tax=Burkholderia cepacia TaxID=292 RepID=UPI001FC8B8B6|nr:hypothetical protein [Burkholderia cepacia]